MKLAISNIGWDKIRDFQVYDLMIENEISGLEIAPTRIIQVSPYDKLDEIRAWYIKLNKEYGFTVPSMQSIWYGRQEKLFGSSEDYDFLIDYTKKSIRFAEVINCHNLVFGCPRNRIISPQSNPSVAVDFFKTLGDFAYSCGTVLAMEANPPIYNTNYINDTMSALSLVKQVNSKGFLLNLDIGTIIQNGESISELIDNVKYINHVHLSEPGLNPIQKRALHNEIIKLLKAENYSRFISIEMKTQTDLELIKANIRYLKEITT